MSNLITADIMLLQDRAPMPDENGLTPGTTFNSANHPLVQQEAMFNRIGTSMYKDGFAAKLLAYAYVCGGGNEAVVLNGPLHGAICSCQQKFNLYGGETPNIKLLPLLKKYIKELEEAVKNSENSLTPEQVPWLKDIFDRYNLNQKKHKV